MIMGLTRRLAWLVLPAFATPYALEAQACLGFGGSGFLSGCGRRVARIVRRRQRPREAPPASISVWWRRRATT